MDTSDSRWNSVARARGHGNIPSDAIKDREFLD
jgi:hypothetical protein